MTAVRPNQFAAHLAKALPPVVLLAGEEPLLIQEALDATRAAAKQQGYTERVSLSVEPGFRWQQVFDECASMSLFASRRVIEVHLPKGPNGHKRGKGEVATDDDGGKAEDGAKALAALAAKPAQDILLLVVAGVLDKRGRESAWFSALDAAGWSVYLWPVKPEELPAFIEQRAQSRGLKLEAEAIALLAERTEGNLLACAQDIEKLALLFPGQPVSAEALLQAVADSSRFEAFDLIDKMLLGDAPGAAHTLARLREEGVNALELVGALAYALRTWAVAGSAYARSRDLHAALSQAKLFGLRARPYEIALKRSRGFSPAAGLARLARVDQAVKTGGDSAAWEDLLALVLAASGSALTARPA
jgi:DNA polymerase III subunit delta